MRTTAEWKLDFTFSGDHFSVKFDDSTPCMDLRLPIGGGCYAFEFCGSDRREIKRLVRQVIWIPSEGQLRTLDHDLAVRRIIPIGDARQPSTMLLLPQGWRQQAMLSGMSHAGTIAYKAGYWRSDLNFKYKAERFHVYVDTGKEKAIRFFGPKEWDN